MIRILLILVALTAPALAQDWRVEVNHAIERGTTDLLRYQIEDGSFETPVFGGYAKDFPMGVTSLAVYTLLKSGLPANDPAITRALDYLRYQPFRKVYSVSLLIFALDATHDEAHRPWILKAAKWLHEKLREQDQRWAYPEGATDLSNTQFAVLALRIARRHEFDLSATIWRDVATKLLDHQNEDGGFGYREDNMPESSGSMTAAGITVLHVAAEEMTDIAGFGRVRRQCLESIERAWGWMDERFTGTGNPHQTSGVLRDVYPGTTWHYYYLYGLERIATFAGRTEIGGRDWYREGAIHLLGSERDQGGWNSLVDTCFALLFLRRATFTSTNPLESTVPQSLYWRFEDRGAPEGWEKPGFDDRRWLRGAGPFGSADSTVGPFRAIWRSDAIHLRRPIYARAAAAPKVRIFVQCDDEAEVWINGVKAGGFPSWSRDFRELVISDEARKAIVEGENLLAARGKNTGGAKNFDLVLTTADREAALVLERNVRPERFLWWRERPEAAIPYLRRWLVLGPIPDSKGENFTRSLLPDATAAPTESSRYKSFAWRTQESDAAPFVLEREGKTRAHSVYYAFTYLEVKKEGRYFLWASADDSLAVWLDGRPMLRHHRPSGSKPDEFPLEMDLAEGTHRLLLKIYNHTGGADFFARISDERGAPTADIVPTLDADRPDFAAAARTQPQLFTLEELLLHLETDRIPRLDFSKEDDLKRVAVGPVRNGWPQWVARAQSGDAYRPSPGASGVMGVWPQTNTQPTRIIRKLRLARDEHELRVRFSPEAYQQPGRAGCRVRVGVFDGKLSWLGAEEQVAPEKPGGAGWFEMKTPLSGYSGREVLVIIECTGRDPSHYAIAYFDEISLR
ncbi:MAG: prenyltransferase/squalene oxidase repeat-containing protein [Planctomycetota bacterium]